MSSDKVTLPAGPLSPALNPSLAFYAMAVLFLSMAAGWLGLRVLDRILLPFDLPLGRWLMLHLITVGAATQALFGSLPALAARHAARPARIPAGSRWLQWLLLNSGWLLVLVGMNGTSSLLAAAGALTIIAAVLLLMENVYRILAGSTSVTSMYYRAAPLFFLVGLTMAMSMLLHWWSPGGYFGMLEAHVHANVWGFVALIAVGTQFLLIPVFAQQPLAKPRWQRPTFWLLTIGASGLVIGPWLEVHALTFSGLGAYAAGIVLLLLNLVRTLRRGRRSPSAAHWISAYLWMVTPVPFAPFIILAPELVPAAGIEAGATLGLVYGWLLQMLMGGLSWVILRLRDPIDNGEDGARAGANRAFDAPLHEREAGSPISPIAVNGGVALLWLNAVLADRPVAGLLEIAGWLLLVVGIAVFIARPWSLLTVPETALAARESVQAGVPVP